jgi:hypothetical protein
VFVVVLVVVVVVVVAVVAVAMVGDTLKGAVRGHKQGVVVLCVVEQLLDLVVLVDQLGKLGRVLALLDQLVDGLVRVAMVTVSAMRGMGMRVVLLLFVVILD